jgi:hypothetical protein
MSMASAYRSFGEYIARAYPAPRYSVFAMPGDWEYNYYLGNGFAVHCYPWGNSLKVAAVRDAAGERLLIEPGDNLPYGDIREKTMEAIDDGFRRELVEEKVFSSRLFTDNRARHAGFYSSDWGFFPLTFSLSPQPLEKFRIYRLVARPE